MNEVIFSKLVDSCLDDAFVWSWHVLENSSL